MEKITQTVISELFQRNDKLTYELAKAKRKIKRHKVLNCILCVCLFKAVFNPQIETIHSEENNN